MRNQFQRINCIRYYLGGLLKILGFIILCPLAAVLWYWGQYGEGLATLGAFFIPAMISYTLGFILQLRSRGTELDMAGSMLLCALCWIAASAVAALPFCIGIGAHYLDAYFESMSGFTTTGITVFSGLDAMPRSILFWRSLIQWLGGIGILSFFLAITFRGTGAHYLFGAESHKISSERPAPGLYNTVKILWCIYAAFTALLAIFLYFEGMPLFDGICHSLTTLSTGGFSTHDASIEFYRQNAAYYRHWRLMEYTITFFMMLGGINFLIHYRVLTRDIKALWDNVEIRYWWGFITIFTLLIMVDHLHQTGALATWFNAGTFGVDKLEETFRLSIFQVISLMTTTGFGTQDINTSFFPALSKQLFLVMMVIGGCVGSTGGGIKVMRIAVLDRLMKREVRRLRVSRRASNPIVIDKQPVPENEVRRIAALFFFWLVLIFIGGAITAFFSGHDAWSSFSGMFSAMGNIGPCYISVTDMGILHPVVKITYIIGMLAGRLELLPVLLLLSPKAWR